MFKRSDDYGYRPLIDGISMNALCHGDKTLMVKFNLKKGHTLPDHAHPYEQTGYMIKGHMAMRIGDEIYDIMPGDSWCIPSDVEHGAKIIEDSIVIEVFSPPRKDYMP